MAKTISRLEINNYLEDIKNRIVAAISPEKIYLFGSYATNNYNSESDIDLFIIVSNSESLRKIQRKINILLDDRIIPIDIVVYSQKKMNKRKDIIGTLPYRINKEGELLYERN